MFYEWQDGNLLLCIKAQPKARKDEFCDVMGKCLKVRITALPVEGKANRHLLNCWQNNLR